MREPDRDAYSNRPHKRECDGELYRLFDTVRVDSIGRILVRAPWAAYDYRCTRDVGGCPARVVVPLESVRRIATNAERRRL